MFGDNALGESTEIASSIYWVAVDRDFVHIEFNYRGNCVIFQDTFSYVSGLKVQYPAIKIADRFIERLGKRRFRSALSLTTLLALLSVPTSQGILILKLW